MKTSELTGAALDWAVAKCEGIYFENLEDFEMYAGDYSTDWAQGGPIIEREKIFVRPKTTGDWRCWIYDGKGEGIKFDQPGPTPLIAAMRCYVASKLGDEVEIPEELT
jgi:hypothetical protein